jgi:HlyD family secretion protein
MKRYLVAGAVAVVILAAGVALFLKSPPKPSYRMGKVERGAILSTVTATGTFNAVITVQVGTQVSGTIQKLFVDYNSVVEKGQPIAQIDPSIFTSQVQQSGGSYQSALANLAKARATLADAKRTMERNRQLVSDGVVSQADFDGAETRFRETGAAVRAAQASVQQTLGAYRQAQTNLRYATIKSPVDGIVVSRNVDVGQTVAASFQTPTLFTIAQDLTKMQINTSVDEADIGKIQVGQPVAFSVDAYPETEFRGVVAQVRNAPIITQNVVTYDVIVTVDNEELKLKPGMTANVAIEVMRKENVMKIPGAALRFKPRDPRGDSGARKAGSTDRPSGPEGQQVYMLRDRKPVPVPVKTGVSDDAFVELVSGNLREGQALIIEQVQKKQKSAQTNRSMGPRF